MGICLYLNGCFVNGIFKEPEDRTGLKVTGLPQSRSTTTGSTVVIKHSIYW